MLQADRRRRTARRRIRRCRARRRRPCRRTLSRRWRPCRRSLTPPEETSSRHGLAVVLGAARQECLTPPLKIIVSPARPPTFCPPPGSTGSSCAAPARGDDLTAVDLGVIVATTGGDVRSASLQDCRIRGNAVVVLRAADKRGCRGTPRRPRTPFLARLARSPPHYRRHPHRRNPRRRRNFSAIGVSAAEDVCAAQVHVRRAGAPTWLDVLQAA